MSLLEKEDKKNNIHSDEEWNATNKDFSQIYNNSINRIIQLTELNPLSTKIFLFFLKEMNTNNTIMVDISTLQKIFNRKKTQVSEAIKILKEHDILVIIKYKRNNVYFINPYISCCTTAPHKRKLIKEYDKLSTEKDSIDNNIINTEVYDKDDKLTYKMSFYKSHENMQKPDDFEEMEYYTNLEQLEKLTPEEQYLKNHDTDVFDDSDDFYASLPSLSEYMGNVPKEP